MSSRQKKIKIFDENINLDANRANIKFLSIKIDHGQKFDHILKGRFSVLQPSGRNDLDIIFYVLTLTQFGNWAISYMIKAKGGSYGIIKTPEGFLYSSKKRATNGEFLLNLSDDQELIFVIDNSFSTTTGKSVNFSLWEEWSEHTESLDALTTIPPYDKSLSEDVSRLIKNSKIELKIITPYIDMSLISLLLEKAERDKVDICIITRDRKEFSGKGAKQAFEHIHTSLGKNHRTNDLVHSRILIRDGSEALVSSADLTQDSLIGQFNAGIIVSNSNVVKKLIKYFDEVWKKSAAQR